LPAVRRLCEHTFVRWSAQLIEEDEKGRLPGRIGEGVVRTFDAPEALDTRFYEVRAKSALNRVPAASRVPFEWTVNPYRGCSHACVYCAWGETSILMADGRTRRLAELRRGDRIYGTEARGRYRRYVKTEVLDHWATIKPAYRVVLDDGTELIASGDHRFLSRRGWKHVVAAAHGRSRRPHLTLGDELVGTGRFADAPADTEHYRRGYLCGLIRADVRAPGGVSRPVPADAEALRRARRCLALLGSAAHEFELRAGAAGDRRPPPAIATDAPDSTIRIEDATAWPGRPTDDWCKGFLAGTFDAVGTFSQGVLRITDTDPRLLDRTMRSLRRLGLDGIVERSSRTAAWTVRVPSGLRFLHTVDPAITRKRDIEGMALTSSAKLRVVAVEPFGAALPLYDITTGTGDFIANGVVSHNCFARPTHEYLDLDAGRDFEREIVVKVNVPEVLRAELARPSWKRRHVAMGTNTDPYQWVEGRYKLMRGIWEALRDAANPCSILTKSPLVLRDIDLLQEVAGRTDVTACLSVPTLDEKAWRASEPRTPNPRARLEAVAELNRAGIPTGILIAPLMPGINDAPEQVEEIIALATEAGATSIGGITLHLRGSVRRVFFDWLRGYRPDLVPRYERLYARGAYVPHRERRLIESAAGLPGREDYFTRFRHRQAGRAPASPRPGPPPAPVQTSLF
jgi:DNA repair photolyase